MRITADFSDITGAVKPMHGVGQAPFYCEDFSLLHYLRDAGVPFARLHDVGNWLGGGLYVDIPNLFRDFDADPNDPAAYDFAFTDRLLCQLVENGVEPFFRLGVSIENSHDLRAYRIFPPRDPEKWAAICEGIVRHYNEGWADGYRMGIRYWEIWNEPDDCFRPAESPMWQGTREEYYRLYEITSKRLRAAFGNSIRIGGYASCGFYAGDDYPDPAQIGQTPNDRMHFFFYFLDGFLRHVRDTGSPFDFFSWHTYADVETACRHANTCRAILNAYGFADVPDILDEWNTCFDVRLRSSAMAASRALAMMLAMQDRSPSLLCYYDARIGPSAYGGMFNPDTWEPYKTYEAFYAFGEAYRMGRQIAVRTEQKADGVQVMGAVRGDGHAGLLLFANPTACAVPVTVDCRGLRPQSLVLTDDTHTRAALSFPADGALVLPPYSCFCVRGE